MRFSENINQNVLYASMEERELHAEKDKLIQALKMAAKQGLLAFYADAYIGVLHQHIMPICTEIKDRRIQALREAELRETERRALEVEVIPSGEEV